MCDPVSLGLQAVGTGLQIFGKLSAGYAGAANAEIQASIASANTKLLTERAGLEKEGAKLAIAGGTLDTARLGHHLEDVYGGETAGAAASHLDPTSGSPLLVQGYSAAQGATDLALIAAKAKMGVAAAYGKSAGTMAESVGSMGQFVAAKMKASQDITAGWFGAASALVSGASSMWKGLSGGGGSGGGGGDSFNPFNTTGSLY